MQPLHFSAGMFFLLLFFSFKTIANSNGQIRRLCADAANEFIRLISLINSVLAFSLFHFFHDNVFAIRCTRCWPVISKDAFFSFSFISIRRLNVSGMESYSFKVISTFKESNFVTFKVSSRVKNHDFSKFAILND